MGNGNILLVEASFWHTCKDILIPEISHSIPTFKATANSEFDFRNTDLLKPGPDDGYPVLDGGDGVRMADGQNSISHTSGFI